MEEQKEANKYIYITIVSTFITAALFGGIILYWQQQKLNLLQSSLKNKINNLEMQLVQLITEKENLTEQLSQLKNKSTKTIPEAKENTELSTSNEKKEITSNDNTDLEKITDWYYKDEDFVYRKNDGMQEPDEYIPYSIITENIDTFEVIDTSYSKDHKNIFYLSTTIKGADVKTFEIVDYPYSKDSNNVYIHGIPLEEADAESFSIVKSGYFAKDKNFVYDMEGKIVEGANPNTFVSPY